MKRSAPSLLGVLVLGSALTIAAQAKPQSTVPNHHAPAVEAPPSVDVLPNAEPAVIVVERFAKALAAADFKTVGSLLDANVLILETGGAERSREQYLAHHAISDAQFLGGARSQLKRRTARVDGNLAWVGTESELQAETDGKSVQLLSTETMVLKNTDDGWRIVHIHWSSRPKKAN